MKKFEGKIALVTGGNSGIGLATAKLLYEQGAKVAIAGRDPKTIAEAVSVIGQGTIKIVADVTSASDLDKLFATGSERLGKIDILFANA
ncbi:MAG: SDR family NAD(P)-dependent oxidoreductase, partial [Bryobacterales bacterium]|nr:SDR family NAD(P)-dependent oxidoreductase [Bryobacterales bacterium]